MTMAVMLKMVVVVMVVVMIIAEEFRERRRRRLKRPGHGTKAQQRKAKQSNAKIGPLCTDLEEFRMRDEAEGDGQHARLQRPLRPLQFRAVARLEHEVDVGDLPFVGPFTREEHEER